MDWAAAVLPLTRLATAARHVKTVNGKSVLAPPAASAEEVAAEEVAAEEVAAEVALLTARPLPTLMRILHIPGATFQ